MNFDEFSARLTELIGESIPAGTLRRWASESIIPKPKRYKKGKGGGKGRAMDWPEEAIWYACAVWKVRNSGVTKKPPSTERILKILQMQCDIYKSPKNAMFSASRFRMTGPYPGTRVELTDVKMTFTEDKELNEQTEIWIAALEKARNRWPMSQTAKVKFYWHSDVIAEEESHEHLLIFVRDDVKLVESNKDEIALIVDGENTLDSLNSGRWFNSDRLSELRIRLMISEREMLWRRIDELRDEIDELYKTIDEHISDTTISTF